MTLRRNASYECRLTASHLPCPAFLATKYTIDGHSINSLMTIGTLVLTRGYCHELSLHVTHFLFYFHSYVTPLGLPYRLRTIFSIGSSVVLHHSDLSTQTATLTLLATDRIIITP